MLKRRGSTLRPGVSAISLKVCVCVCVCAGLPRCHEPSVDPARCQCYCVAGWGGEDCRWRECPFGCSGHGLCHNGTCACSAGFTGSDCSDHFLSGYCPPGFIRAWAPTFETAWRASGGAFDPTPSSHHMQFKCTACPAGKFLGDGGGAGGGAGSGTQEAIQCLLMDDIKSLGVW